MRDRIKAMAAKVAVAIAREVGLREALLVAGLAAVARGLNDIFPPAAWVFVGLVLMALALRRARSE